MRLNLRQFLYVACGVTFAGAAVFTVGYNLDRSEQKGHTAFVEYLTDIMMSQADSTISDAIEGMKQAERLNATSCTNANVKKLQAIALARLPPSCILLPGTRGRNQTRKVTRRRSRNQEFRAQMPPPVRRSRAVPRRPPDRPKRSG